MSGLKCAAIDLIDRSDRERGIVTFTDKASEMPKAQCWRLIGLEVAITHPAFGDVHVSSVELGVL